VAKSGFWQIPNAATAGHPNAPENRMRYALPALTTLAAVLLYVVTSVNVGRARSRFGIAAPAVTGHPDFERVYRVQMNTLEQLVAFLPALWLFALYLSPSWAATLGSAWIAGRVVYAVGYYRAAEKRGPGFGITVLAFGALWLGAAWGVVRALLQG
jgi:glutathione S-transferase